MSLIKKNDLIYIAGHSGMVGSAITRYLKKFMKIILTFRTELDSNNKEENYLFI